MKKLSVAIVLALGLLGSAAVSADSTESGHYIGFLPGYYHPDTGRGAGNKGFTVSALYGYEFIDGLSVEANIFGSEVDENSLAGNEFHQEGGTLDLRLRLYDSETAPIVPFVIAGAGAAYNDVYARGIFRGTFLADAGIGFVTKTLIDPLKLRFEARYLYNNFQGEQDDFRVSLGLEIPVGGHKVAQLPPEAPQVVETVPPAPVEAPAPVPPVLAPAPIEPPPPAIVTLKGVNFKLNSAVLQPSSYEALQPTIEFLLKNPGVKIEIAGHTDATGSAAYNLKLSQKRAEAVKEFLSQHFIDAGRMSAHGYGSTQPLVTPEKSEVDRAANRRVEMRILSQ